MEICAIQIMLIFSRKGAEAQRNLPTDLADVTDLLNN